MKRQTESGRTLTIRIAHNRMHWNGQQKLLGGVVCVCEGGGKGGVPIALGSAVVKKHTRYSVRVKDF